MDVHSRPRKKLKLKHVVPILLGTINTCLGKPKYEPVRILLDSGTSGSIVLQHYVKKLRLKQSNKTTLWKTKGGTFMTEKECKILFQLPELDLTKIIEWTVHVDEKVTPADTHYDMIIGTDMLQELGIVLNFSTCEIQWDTASVPMRDRDLLGLNTETLNYFYEESYESEPVRKATVQMTGILDAKYEKADLDQITTNCIHLMHEQRTTLNLLLKKYEYLFDGTLGCWNTRPLD